MENNLKKILKLQKDIENFGEDKLNSIIWRGLCQHLITQLLEFDEYLLKTKNTKVLKRFEKVIQIIRENEHLL